MKKPSLLKNFQFNRMHSGPILVWLCAVVCVLVLFFHRFQHFEVVGIAQPQMREIAATSTGRIKSVTVQLFEEVREGQIIAVLDDEYIQAELDTTKATIQQLRAELTSTQERLFLEVVKNQADWITMQRQFSLDIEEARLRILELRAFLEADRIILKNLELDVNIIQEGVEMGVIGKYELDKVKIEYDTLAKKIEENENIYKQAELDLKEAEHRNYEFAQNQPLTPLIDTVLEPIRQAIKVQEQVINELLVEHEELVLRSPFNGIVSQIQHSLGEAVMAGESILVIAEAEPREIIAYASETQVGRFREGTRVTLIKNRNPAQIANSQVISVGSTVEMMPERLWQNPNIPRWGCPMLIKIPPGLELLPGELVGVRS